MSSADPTIDANPIPVGAQRVLLYGGSFDPPHIAHTTLPLLVRDAIDANAVVFIPAARSPFKENAPAATNDQRVEMLRLALAGTERTAIATLEFERDGASYTVDTLRRLREERPETELRLLIGADQARSFHRWRDALMIMELAPPAVMLRPGQDGREALIEKLRPHWDDDAMRVWHDAMAPIPRTIEASSTEIRALLEDDPKSHRLDEMLHPDVLAYVRRTGLYRSPRA